MLTRLVICTYLILVFSLNLHADQQDFPFFEGSLDELSSMAKTQNKPYFIYLHSEHTTEVRQMDPIWQDPELIFFVDRNYLAYELNVSNGPHTFIEKYELETFPSFIFFNPNGTLVGLQEGELTAVQLLGMLETFFFELEDPLRTVYLNKATITDIGESEYAASNTPTGQLGISRSQLTEVARTEIHPLIVSGFEEYSIQRLENEESNVYSLLIESFENRSDLEKSLQRFKRIWKGAIWVYSDMLTTQKRYHLFLGQYPSKEEAGYFAKSIAKLEANSPKILDFTIILK